MNATTETTYASAKERVDAAKTTASRVNQLAMDVRNALLDVHRESMSTRLPEGADDAMQAVRSAMIAWQAAAAEAVSLAEREASAIATEAFNAHHPCVARIP